MPPLSTNVNEERSYAESRTIKVTNLWCPVLCLSRLILLADWIRGDEVTATFTYGQAQSY